MNEKETKEKGLRDKILKHLTKCVDNFDFKEFDGGSIDALIEKAAASIRDAVNTASYEQPFYNILLDSTFNTFEIIAEREQKFRRRLERHVEAQNGDKTDAVNRLLGEVITELEAADFSRSSFVNNLTLRIKAYSMLYPNDRKVKEILELGLLCENENVKKVSAWTAEYLEKSRADRQ